MSGYDKRVNHSLATAPTPAKKLDQGKPRTDLLPADALLEVSEVLAFGAEKYGDRNWETGFTYGRLTGAILRHTFAFMSGEDKDPESGKSHLAHATCACLMLLALIKRGKGKDDRSL